MEQSMAQRLSGVSHATQTGRQRLAAAAQKPAPEKPGLLQYQQPKSPLQRSPAFYSTSSPKARSREARPSTVPAAQKPAPEKPGLLQYQQPKSPLQRSPAFYSTSSPKARSREARPSTVPAAQKPAPEKPGLLPARNIILVVKAVGDELRPSQRDVQSGQRQVPVSEAHQLHGSRALALILHLLRDHFQVGCSGWLRGPTHTGGSVTQQVPGRRC
ncbi:hypothetical protein P4O66_015730 [Electrophorus voltai]|uniref:Uncharacterized protein n=1 Tax=Electrophorus voltai TaxID=2609070 RepID=A0AAD8YZG8_9TELE|nr:hypothetical protein P4O66_015730 [Electrophorus voltai]